MKGLICTPGRDPFSRVRFPGSFFVCLIKCFPSTLKRKVGGFEKLHFHDGLVWTEGLTREIKLHFWIPRRGGHEALIKGNSGASKIICWQRADYSFHISLPLMSSVYSAAVAAALKKLVLYKSDYSALHVKDRGDLRNDQNKVVWNL